MTRSKIPWNRTDLISVFNTILAILIGFWGIGLTYISIKHSDQIASQQQRIKGFDELLLDSKTQSDTLNKAILLLSKQLLILDSQLQLNQKEQKKTNDISESETKENMLSLEYTSQAIAVLLSDGSPDNPQQWDSLKRTLICNKLLVMIDKVLYNPILLDNDSLREWWGSDRNSVEGYLNYSTKEKQMNINENGKLRKGTTGDWNYFMNMMFLGDREFIIGHANKTFQYIVRLKAKKYPGWNNKYNIYKYSDRHKW